MIDDKKIKSKYKQLKYQYLKKIYNKNLSKVPNNCKYNKIIELPNKTKLNICGFNFEDNFEIDLCYKTDHAKNCNAFCPIKTKEELYQDFIDDIRDDQSRATKYKDINLLFWLNPELTLEDNPSKSLIKVGIFRSLINFLKKFFL